MTPRLTARRAGLVIAAVGVTACVVAWLISRGRHEPRPLPPASFDGPSDQLLRTVVVPTLDTPLPEGKSAVWCVSFQLAWNRLRDDLAGGPIQLANAQPEADRLNRAGPSEGDVDPASVYATAGPATADLGERIRAALGEKFPGAPNPDLRMPPQGVVAYAYLAASARYDLPFFENDEPFRFTESAGREVAVGSFGIRKKDDYAYRELRRQVRVLYRPREPFMGREMPEFVVDLCQTSQPYQVVVARVDRKPTLEATLADIQEKTAAQGADRFSTELNPVDTLLVPNMGWRISHRFRELEGEDKRFSNPALRDLYLSTAAQTVQFRLDRSGVELASEAKVLMKPTASYFHVNRPFLVYVKKRGGTHPCFVAWVENAELLQEFSANGQRGLGGV